MKTELNKLEQMGMAALMPGMQYLLDKMQSQLDEFREMLAAAQRGTTPAALLLLDGAPKRRGRPPGVKNGTSTLRNGWPVDPAERSAEMKRRMAVAAGHAEPQIGKRKVYKGDASHPRHPDHPDHVQWVAKMAKAQRKHWRALTPAQRQDRILRMGGARIKKAASQIRVAV